MAKKKTYKVLSGDSWFKIAGKIYGDQRMAGALMEANPGINMLLQGQVLSLPPSPSGGPGSVFFSNESFGRGLLANQGLIEAGGKPSGAKIADYAKEDLKAFFPAQDDYAKAMQVWEAGQFDDRQRQLFEQGFYTPLEEDLLAEEVAQAIVDLGMLFPEELSDFDPLSIEEKTTLAAAAGKPQVKASSKAAQASKDLDKKLEEKAQWFGFEAEAPLIDKPTQRERLLAPRPREAAQEQQPTLILPSMTLIEGLYNERKTAQEGGEPEKAENVLLELTDYMSLRGYPLDVRYEVTEAEIPEGWPLLRPIDEMVIGVDQWDDDVFLFKINGQEIKGTACGLVAASTAAAALGYGDSDFQISFEIIAGQAGEFGYVPTVGISPDDFEKTIEAIIENPNNPLLGATGEINVYSGGSDVDALERIRQELWAGNEVIVDILATYISPIGGTLPIRENGPNDAVESFAHFVRVLGFSEDGQTIYLAETLKPPDINWNDEYYQFSEIVEVDRDIFLAAWQNPEGRADGNYDEYGNVMQGYTVQPYDYWMLVISPPIN